MNMLKSLTVLVLGSAILAGCGAGKDESAAQTKAPPPAADAPDDQMSPADTTDTLPSDEPDPAMSDTLPPAEEPPPTEPPPPPG